MRYEVSLANITYSWFKTNFLIRKYLWIKKWAAQDARLLCLQPVGRQSQEASWAEVPRGYQWPNRGELNPLPALVSQTRRPPWACGFPIRIYSQIRNKYQPKKENHLAIDEVVWNFYIRVYARDVPMTTSSVSKIKRTTEQRFFASREIYCDCAKFIWNNYLYTLLSGFIWVKKMCG